MAHFAKRLVSKGIKITLVTIVFISKSFFPNPFSTTSIDLETISNGFDEGGSNQALSAKVYLQMFCSVGLGAKLVDTGDRPVLIYDGFLRWALDVAKQFGIPSAVFFTQSCAVNNVYYHVRGFFSCLCFQRLMFHSLDCLCFKFRSCRRLFLITNRSRLGLMLSSQVVDWMSSFWNVMTIGPTIPSMYLDKRLDDDKDYGMNLFNPEIDTCRSWLNGKPNGSVVYVSFGSLASPEANQMQELALALKGSDCNFLWVVRETTEMAKLPAHFIEETKEKGLVVTWCNQLEVLSRDSICCFLTHCGLNSVLEALSLGVPMLGMLFWTDQITNTKLVEDVWGIGITSWRNQHNLATKETIKRCLNELVNGEKSKEIKMNTIKRKNLVKKTVEEGGISDKNNDEFIAKLLEN
ncbi:hypothetical protein CXB51_016442 [Gossypium anomalum]|uniref:Glycosyltransferase n=1 Tax=Gossypium anomalum TaxID=47600 RepID=A0A8J5YWI0_9ROSI|nr:hypothetical protein CXB51_016442 [Gossypium anomalum]